MGSDAEASDRLPGDRRSERDDPSNAVIQVRELTKAYGHVQALAGASLEIRRGEILALLGDNGAGKSTLTKCISGAISPDAGEITVNGERTRLLSTRHAQDMGIETVYQDLAQAPDLGVADNMFLGRELYKAGVRARFGVLDRVAMAERAQSTLRDLGVSVPPHGVPVRDLSGGQRQAVAVGRAAMWATTAILMDEPTAALGPRQTALVYEAIRAGASRGLAVVVVSHDIPHMLTLAHRVAVMRHGRVVVTLDARATTLSDVISLMLGGEEMSA